MQMFPVTKQYRKILYWEQLVPLSKKVNALLALKL